MKKLNEIMNNKKFSKMKKETIKASYEYVKSLWTKKPITQKELVSKYNISFQALSNCYKRILENYPEMIKI